MGLVSYLASTPQVLRVAPYYRTKLLNAVAKSISQSASITKAPLTDAGLHGSGEVIQVKTLTSYAGVPTLVVQRRYHTVV